MNSSDFFKGEQHRTVAKRSGDDVKLVMTGYVTKSVFVTIVHEKVATILYPELYKVTK